MKQSLASKAENIHPAASLIFSDHTKHYAGNSSPQLLTFPTIYPTNELEMSIQQRAIQPADLQVAYRICSIFLLYQEPL